VTFIILKFVVQWVFLQCSWCRVRKDCAEFSRQCKQGSNGSCYCPQTEYCAECGYDCGTSQWCYSRGKNESILRKESEVQRFWRMLFHEPFQYYPSKLLWNISNFLPDNTASYYRRVEFLSVTLRISYLRHFLK